MSKSRVITEEGRQRMREGGRKGGKKGGRVGFAILKEQNPELLKEIAAKAGRIGGKAPKKKGGDHEK